MYTKTGYIFSPVVTVLGSGKVLKSESITVDHITDLYSNIRPQNSMSDSPLPRSVLCRPSPICGQKLGEGSKKELNAQGKGERQGGSANDVDGKEGRKNAFRREIWARKVQTVLPHDACEVA